MAIEELTRFYAAARQLNIREADVIHIVDSWRDDYEMGKLFKKLLMDTLSGRTGRGKERRNRIHV